MITKAFLYGWFSNLGEYQKALGRFSCILIKICPQIILLLLLLGIELVAQSCLILCHPMHSSPQAFLSMGFSRQEYWTGQPFPSRGDLPDPGFEPRSLTMQQILHHLSHQGSSNKLSHGAQGQKMQAGLPQLKIVTGMLLEQSCQKSLSFASLMPHNLYLYHTYLFSGSYLYLSPHFAIMDASKERSHSLNFQVLVLQSSLPIQSTVFNPISSLDIFFFKEKNCIEPDYISC